jgi:hypothetical protein
MKSAHLLLLATTVALAACATTSQNTDTPTGPGQLVNLTLQPARVSPNPQGALLLGSWTGCRIDYVDRGPGENVWQFRVSPTARVPKIEQCLESLRGQPGVTGVQPVK